MVEVIQLAAGEWVPKLADEEPWLIVEASDDGRFFGTGRACNAAGEVVIYASLSEDDVSLEAALAAATDWAMQYGLRRIWVQAIPD